MDPREIFDEPAITAEEALGASERFIAFRTDKGISFQMAPDDHAGPLMSLDEIQDLLSRKFEGGALVTVED